jgi:hypothetical protein
MTMVSTGQVKRFSAVAVAVLAVFAGLAAPPARAATDAEQAEALIREGVKLRARDNAPKALPVFEKAYQISRSPRTAAQLGLCELELGYYVAADRYLTEALAAPDHPWVSKNKTALTRALDSARANIGELALVVSPAGAEVSLNKKPLDKALVGPPVRLDKGPVDVEVRAPGYEPTRETITIVGGKREQRTFALVREAATAAGASEIRVGPVVSLAPTASDPSAAAVTLNAAPPPGEDGGRTMRRTAAWITGGAALAALLFGTVEAFNAAGKSDAFNTHTGVIDGVEFRDCGTANLSPACKGLKEDYDQALTLSVVGFAAAGVLAATSSVLFLLSPSGENSGATERGSGARAVTCVPDPRARGFGCSLRF